MKKIRVFIVDDSALIRHVLSTIVNAQPDMEVAAAATDPYQAREMLRSVEADVMTLDVEMPMMNGIEFLGRLMAARPMPVIMISSLTEKGSDMTLQALELGAVDFMCKPRPGATNGLRGYAEDICAKLRAAASARVKMRPLSPATGAAIGTGKPPAAQRLGPCHDRVILVGASTGGTEAIKTFLTGLPADAPPVLIAQHMPENFTRSFAQRLDSTTHFSVFEAADGQAALPGQVYIAPGHSHLLLQRRGKDYFLRLSKADPVNRHRPSVDVLFHSGAQIAAAHALGVILTGMGKDGAAGLRAMHETGASTFAQDEQSCVVFGMPREAIALGGVDEIVPLQGMAQRVTERLREQQRGHAITQTPVAGREGRGPPR